jgi:hypothetical protein
MGLRPLDKTLKPAETLTFSPPIEQAKSPTGSVASGPAARYVIASGGEVAMSSVQTGNSRKPHHPKERHFLPGSSAGVCVPKNK